MCYLDFIVARNHDKKIDNCFRQSYFPNQHYWKILQWDTRKYANLSLLSRLTFLHASSNAFVIFHQFFYLQDMTIAKLLNTEIVHIWKKTYTLKQNGDVMAIKMNTVFNNHKLIKYSKQFYDICIGDMALLFTKKERCKMVTFALLC